MKTSESIKEIAPAFLKAQMGIQAVIKDKTGKIETKSGARYEYKYSDLASVIENVKGPLNEAGIAFIQSPSSDASGVTVTTTFLHSSGEWFADTIYLPVSQSTAQGYGSAITYGKRYQLQSMTGLPSEDDDGKGAEKTAAAKWGNNGAEINKIEFENMSIVDKARMNLHASSIIDIFNSGDEVAAADYCAAKLKTAEEKMAVWALLPSNVRSSIKRNTKPALASQP